MCDIASQATKDNYHMIPQYSVMICVDCGQRPHNCQSKDSTLTLPFNQPIFNTQP